MFLYRYLLLLVLPFKTISKSVINFCVVKRCWSFRFGTLLSSCSFIIEQLRLSSVFINSLHLFCQGWLVIFIDRWKNRVTMSRWNPFFSLGICCVVVFFNILCNGDLSDSTQINLLNTTQGVSCFVNLSVTLVLKAWQKGKLRARRDIRMSFIFYNSRLGLRLLRLIIIHDWLNLGRLQLDNRIVKSCHSIISWFRFLINNLSWHISDHYALLNLLNLLRFKNFAFLSFLLRL